MKSPVKLDDPRNREAVTENETFAAGITLIRPVVFDHPLAPDKGVARIVPCPVKELAEVHIEVFEEGFNPVDVRKRNAQVPAVLFGPHLKAEDLAVTKARAQGLTGLQVLVRHGAD